VSTRTLEQRLRRLEALYDRGRQADVRDLPRWLHVRANSGKTDVHQPAVDPSWRYRALPAQRNFHSDLETRFKSYSGPIGSGKSHALSYEAIFLSSMNPGLLGFIGAPTYPMLRDSTQRAFFEVLETEKIAYTFHKQQNKVRSRKRLGNHLPQPR
jgi:hypothetical protein